MTTPDHNLDESPTSELDIDADASDIWHALTTDDGLADWMGEGASIDAIPGGGIHAPDPIGGRVREGEVERVEPDRRLDFTWWPSDDPGDQSSVSITLEPVEVGTRIRVVERPLSPVAAAASPVLCQASWAWRTAAVSVARMRACV